MIKGIGNKNFCQKLKLKSSLGKIKDPLAQIPLTSALRDQDYSVREEAADALGSLEPLAIKPLITALRDKDAQISAGAAIALVVNKDPKVKDLIVQAADEGSHHVRALIAKVVLGPEGIGRDRRDEVVAVLAAQRPAEHHPG